jgi:eukaryotic-like serine/threonine-protein kinase
MLIGHGPEDEPVSPRNNVFDKPPLRVAVAGGEGESWAAGDGFVLRFDRGGVTPEPIDANGSPVAMELDPVGVPWLLTERAILRRQGLGAPRWRVYHEHEASAPPFVALGFTPMGARLIDAKGGGVLLEPEDITAWRQ